MDTASETWLESVLIAQLKPHPRNYRSHPEDQIEHLVARIRKFGIYRNIVVARDLTILAGHGITEAARRMGYEEMPVKRIDVDPTSSRALQIMAGDNEVEHLAQNDDRALSELLKEINDNDIDGLLGTGYDDMMLANLAMVTRPASEIADHNEAAHWVGLPEYEPMDEPWKVVFSFETEQDRNDLARKLGMEFKGSNGKTARAWWPPRENDDRVSLRFDG